MPLIELLASSSDQQAELPRLPASEIADLIETMRHQEASPAYQCTDYLEDSLDLRESVSKPVDEDCRVRMCEWCFQVVDFCKFNRETVATGMSYLDRFLCTPSGMRALVDRKQYQLAAMTTLYMAIKLKEPLEMETSLLAELSRGCYTDKEIADMEQKILEALNWRVSGPTALCFVQHFMSLFPSTVDKSVGIAVLDYARYQTEVAVTEYTFVCVEPSRVALGAILNALEGVDRKRLPVREQGKFWRAVENASGMMREEVLGVKDALSDVMLDMLPERKLRSNDSESSSSWSKSTKYSDASKSSRSRESSPVSVTRTSSSSKRHSSSRRIRVL